MNTTIEKIQSAYRNVRSYTTFPLFLESLTALSVCRKSNPELLQGLHNMGIVNQMTEVEALYQSSKQANPQWLKFLRYTEIQNVLEVQLLLLMEAQDDAILAQALRTLFTRLGHEFAGAQSGISEINLFKELVGDCQGKAICDAAAGIASVASSLNADKLYLQEISPTIYAFSAAFLFLEGKDVHFSLGDALYDKIPTREADIVILTPPMGLRIQSFATQYSFPSLVQANAPASGGNSLWVQLALACLKTTGKAFILLPPGWFWRGGYDAKVRDALLKHEYVEAVIELPQRFLAHTHIAPCLLILNKNRSKGAAIHFVDATTIANQEGRYSFFSADDCLTIAELVKGNMPHDRRFVAKFLSEIRQSNAGKGNSLAVSEFIQKETSIVKPDLEIEMEKLSMVEQEFVNAQEHLKTVINNI